MKYVAGHLSNCYFVLKKSVSATFASRLILLNGKETASSASKFCLFYSCGKNFLF
jgi:hypothetical protein